MPAVEIRNVTKTFGQHTAVDALSLTVPDGCVYGFIGPNGSGKTTTLRMIMNIFYPDTGSIEVFGEPRTGACTDRIGYLPEERGLYKKMKVRDVLRFYGHLKNGKNVDAQIDHWLKRLDLTDWANKQVQALSKGMSQKVQFIAAVVAEPELIILDEPFSGLDPVNADVLTEAVLELRSQGRTVIFSTHDMNTAEAMCDFIFMIFKGKKVLDGTLDDIQDRYGSDTIRIRTNGDRPDLDNIPGIEPIRNYGRQFELRMTDDCDPQQALAAIMNRTPVEFFEVTRPSLHDIFVRIAAPDAEENGHGQSP